MSNGRDGFLGSHENRMEFAAVVGLAQQRQQVNLQRATLAEQQYTNYLMATQVAIQNQQELQRQKEKLADLWCREFEHQGMSPLKAHEQAMAEFEIKELIRGGSEILESYGLQLEQGYEKVVKPALSEAEFPINTVTVFGMASTFFGFMQAQYWVVAVGVILFGLAYYFVQQKKDVDQEALIFSYQKELTTQTQNNLRPYLEALNELPKSKLFDDKPVKKILSDFIAIDVHSYSDETE